MNNMKQKILSLLVLLLTAATGAWADDYTITLPTVSNGSVVAKVSDVSVTSAAADATVSLVATPDAGYKLKTISATTSNISETFSSGANNRTGTYFSVSGSNYAYGWRIGSGDNYKLTISSLSNQNLSQVVLTVGNAPNVSQRNISHLQADHGTLSATGTTQGNTITITGINSPTVTVSAPGSNNGASMWSITQAKVDGLGAITLTDTSDDNVKTFTMPSGNVTVSAEFEEPTIEVTWDVATKTGTFNMPDYDVEIAPIYAPAAKWATEGDAVLAPTAVEGIIAGTEDAIVKAGTVAKTGDNVQGTAMYFATTDAEMTAEKAAKADGWLATLPTAAGYDGAQTVYVWYYIKGADTPQGQTASAENTFNDLEICTTPLKVEVLSNKFDIQFNAANANTIEAGKATVKVGETAVEVKEGKLTGVKMDSKVTITAKDGYKFRKAEATKTVNMLYIEASNHKLYYMEGETWRQAINNHTDLNQGWQYGGMEVCNIVNVLKGNGAAVDPGSVIDPTKTYTL